MIHMALTIEPSKYIRGIEDGKEKSTCSTLLLFYRRLCEDMFRHLPFLWVKLQRLPVESPLKATLCLVQKGVPNAHALVDHLKQLDERG